MVGSVSKKVLLPPPNPVTLGREVADEVPNTDAKMANAAPKLEAAFN